MSSKPRRIDFDGAKAKESSSAVAAAAASSSTSRKRTLNPYEKKQKGIVGFATPSKKSRLAEQEQQSVPVQEEEEEEYVPSYIYKNIEYKREGCSKDLDPVTQKVFSLVKQHYSLPKDLETNRRYGPKSGICYEQHAIRAYSLGLLVASNPADSDAPMICTACAGEGHKRDDCPSLI